MLGLAIALACGYAALSRVDPSAAAPRRAPVTARLPVDAADVETLMRHVRALAADSMEGRLIGTPGSARARAYLVRAFAEAGLAPLGASYEHPFVIDKLHLRPPLGPRRITYHGTNVLGVVRGRLVPDRYIVVSAHYDHLGTQGGEVYNGADDNASGAAALPVLAAWFRAHPPAHSLIFAAFDGEERGRLGARAFLRNPPVPAGGIALDVNLDMVGRNARGELFAAGTHQNPALHAPLDSVAWRAPVALRFGHDRPTWRLGDDWTGASDHAEFHARGIPFVYFGVEDHPDYHRPTDDPERLMPLFYAGAVTTVRDAIATLDGRLTAPTGGATAGRLGH